TSELQSLTNPRMPSSAWSSDVRSEEHTSELQSLTNIVCRLLLEKKKSLTATDLDLSLRTSCNAQLTKAGACTIPARKLYDYVKLRPDADITIRLFDIFFNDTRTAGIYTLSLRVALPN